jgi:hypothetical protein
LRCRRGTKGGAEHGRDEGCAITFWHDPEERTLIFYAATLLFLANFALGVLVQFGIVDTKPFRWLHHALFFAVFASAGLAVFIGFAQGAPYRWALVPVLGLYLILPRVRAGTPGHAALALAAMVLYAAGFARTIQGV